jgi:hypothetical protein
VLRCDPANQHHARPALFTRRVYQSDRLTDIVGLKLVDSPDTGTRSSSQSPLGKESKERHLSLVNVVDDARVKSDVRVDNEGGGQDGVDDGLSRRDRDRAMLAMCSSFGDLVASYRMGFD